jgi:hypothetical protein
MSVSICGPCDHGNIFCPGECAAVSRRASNRRASARYQRTRRGARRHAARQQTWRERQRDKVTQQGCASVGPVFTMSITVDMAVIETPDAPSAPEERSARRRSAITMDIARLKGAIFVTHRYRCSRACAPGGVGASAERRR